MLPSFCAASSPVSKVAHQYQFPTKDWTVANPELVGVDPKSFERFLAYVFPEQMDWTSRSGIRTEALVVIKDGLLIYEKYIRGFAPEKRHLAWSVTKVLSNALVARAVAEGRLHLNDSVSKYINLPQTLGSRDLKIRDLLEWSSGLNWSENYEYNPLGSSVLKMLYGLGSQSIADFTLGRGFAKDPGAEFNYSSGDTNLLMRILQKSMSAKDYENYPWKEVFEPLGIRSAVLERDASGAFVGSSYLHITPRDLAKLGLLYLNDGVWASKRLLPEGWVAQSVRVVPSYRQSDADIRMKALSPGRQFWVNRPDLSRNIKSPLPDVPPDMFAGLGHWGQLLVVIPSLNLVVVRMGDDRTRDLDLNKMFRLLAESLDPVARRLVEVGRQ